jgi:hypothetical protein
VSTPKKSIPQDLEGPAVDFTPPPPKPTMIGPTPQKDGIFIGIFDNLPAVTPSRNRTILGDADINTAHTPSKVLATPEHIHTQARHSRTPMSVGKRFMLDQYVTPGKRKATEEGTPSTLSKRFMTPAFLRRDTSVLEVVAEDEIESPRAQRSGWQRPIIMRSLSSMIKSLRQEEDEQLDEDLDLLREMEDDGESGGQITTSAVERSSLKSRDSGVGFDQELDNEGFLNYDVGEELKQVQAAEAAEAEETGQPKRVWKKRGQKRQTKRGNSKPMAQSHSYAFANLHSQCGLREENRSKHRKMLQLMWKVMRKQRRQKMLSLSTLERMARSKISRTVKSLHTTCLKIRKMKLLRSEQQEGREKKARKSSQHSHRKRQYGRSTRTPNRTQIIKD